MRVVIAEDHALLREGLVLLLTSAGHEVVAAATTAPEILPALRQHRPDAAVLDVRMPPDFRDEGLRAALTARKELPGLPVLVLSQYVEESYAAELLAGGASGLGYLLKDRVGRVDEFLDALERVAAGGTALDPEVVTELLTRRRDSPLDSLTPRERESWPSWRRATTTRPSPRASSSPNAPSTNTSATSSSSWGCRRATAVIAGCSRY